MTYHKILVKLNQIYQKSVERVSNKNSVMLYFVLFYYFLPVLNAVIFIYDWDNNE